jgi:DNA-directed RNA polymerase subunit N (RpoN/RPB10)
MVFDASVTPSLECLFDAVGIDNPCCRMHITSKTNFNKLYK